MKHKFTHTGIVRGNDARTPDNFHYKVKLRKTKLFWITEKGIKYRVSSGYLLGDWPTVRLDLDSIKEI